MVRIILGGMWRGNELSWNLLKQFKEYHSAEVYVAMSNGEDWKLPFHFHSIESNVLDNTIFNKSTHPHKDKYISQWSSLYKAYTFFSDKFDSNDIVIKLRNDLIYQPFNLKDEDNTIYTPIKEFHTSTPFPTDLLCNDQIIYGTNSVMKKYFNLPYDYIYTDRNPMAIKMYGDMLGIEETLRNYLYQKDIKLQTFDLNYTKV